MKGKQHIEHIPIAQIHIANPATNVEGANDVANIREVGLRKPIRWCDARSRAEGKQFDLVAVKEGSRPSLLCDGHTSDHYRGNARRSVPS